MKKFDTNESNQKKSSDDKPQNAFTRRALLKRGSALVGGALVSAAPLTGFTARAEAIDTAVAQAFIDAWNSHDPDKVVALFTADAVVEDVTFGAVSHGLAEIRAFAEGTFAAVPDLHFDLVNSSLKGGHGTIEWVLSGTDTGAFGGTGNPFSVHGVTVMEVHGTKLTLERDYWDLATVLRQIGLL